MKTRFRHMLFGWGSVGIAYLVAGLLQRRGAVLPETALDALIPFSPAAIWLYASFFALVPFTYLTAEPARLPWLAASMQVCAAVCGAVFILWPTTLAYPEMSGRGPSEAFMRVLLSLDSSQNCLPSLHAALTLLCVWALLDARHRLRSVLAVVAGLAICHAIIQLRRHVSIDVSAGALVGLASGWLCRKLRPAPGQPS